MLTCNASIVVRYIEEDQGIVTQQSTGNMTTIEQSYSHISKHRLSILFNHLHCLTDGCTFSRTQCHSTRRTHIDGATSTSDAKFDLVHALLVSIIIYNI